MDAGREQEAAQEEEDRPGGVVAHRSLGGRDLQKRIHDQWNHCGRRNRKRFGKPPDRHPHGHAHAGAARIREGGFNALGVDVAFRQKEVGQQPQDRAGDERQKLAPVGHGADFNTGFGHG